MRLRFLDIQGFKSFADRTKLEFNDGITAVIGPNGSGKSNIADAVRWVLGEQSTRLLRGGKMEDVIFGGTQSRKAMGVASVTLGIDNADRSLGLDCDEVAVTRRLYRSGDSEYRVNGTQVRLKDVNELFMDTGLGRDGYSIIGQGRVSEIVSARSRERREIFEEAAGISKFRYRKTEAERRLAMAEDNLLRLRDILSELDARVGPLKEQSVKAKKYLELAADRKNLEVSVWMRTLADLRVKSAAVEDKLLLARAGHDEAEAAVAALEGEYAAEMEQGRALMVEIEDLRAESSRTSEQIMAWESEAAVLQNDVGHHERAIAEARGAMERTGRSQGDIEGEIAEKRAALALREQGAAELREAAGALAARLEELAAGQRETAEGLETLRLRRAGVFEAIETAKLDAASSETLLGEGRARLGAMDGVERRNAEAVTALEGEEADCRALRVQIDEELLSLQNAAQGYNLKRESRRKKLDELDRQAAERRRGIDERRQRARLLSDMDKNMEGFGQSVKSVMAQARAGALKGVLGPVSSLVGTDGGHTVAVETALGGALQNIVVDNEETAKRAIAFLKSSKAGRATFLPLTSVKGNRLDPRGIDDMDGFVGLACDLVRADERYRGVVTSLLGRIVVAEDIDAAVAMAKRHGYRFRVVTLDGQVVNAGGSMTGGYTARSAGILGRQAEIERLLAQVAGMEAEDAELGTRRAAAERELAGVDAELAVLDARRKTHEEDAIRCDAELSRIVQTLAQARRQAADALAEREALTRRVEEIRRKSADSREMTQRLTDELDELQRLVAREGDRRDELAARRAQLIERQSEQSAHVMLLERDLAAARQELERLEGALGNNERQRAELGEKITRLRAEIDGAAARAEELSALARDGREQVARRQEDILGRMARRNQSEQRCTELRGAERERSARRDGLYRELVRLGEQKKGFDAELSGIVSRLYDEYELTQSDAEELAQPIGDLPAAGRRLAELRGKIKALGAVNVGSIEEYAEVSERHETLTRQLFDVERSKAELTRMIGELTGQMREIFTAKFEQIGRNFSLVFRELFEGGSASLSLTDESDVLESGIEISVHPPGKLIKNLASLSGGEQAFVAIAIFFSILKVNPAPFCLMDEIEAALDDVNVSKFAAYLRTMTAKTQFITVTHRRGTMEEADVLYGVTMQEEGISKLLELKVSELEKGYGVK